MLRADAALDAIGALGASSGSEEEGAAEAALDRVAAAGDVQSRRAANACNARAVWVALQRRERIKRKVEANDAAAAASEPGAALVSFFERKGPGDKRWPAEAVNDLVFQRIVKSSRIEADIWGSYRQEVTRVREVTLFRYVKHRSDVMLRKTGLECEGPAVAHRVVSMAVKWDETEQVVRCELAVEGADACPGAPKMLVDGRVTTISTEHIMTFGVFVKTADDGIPSMFSVPPVRIQRTTAECLFTALKRCIPMGPWGVMPTQERVDWLIFVLCGDEATSNRRLYAQLEQFAHQTRGGLVTLWCPCFLHILHRSIVPALRVSHAVDHLFRAANVLQVGTYWQSLLSATKAILKSSVVVLHHSAPADPAHQAVARHLLELTLGAGLPWNDIAPQRKETIEYVIEVFSGCWTSERVTFRCQDADCEGGAACQQRAVDKMLWVVSRAIFGSRPQIPSLSRWWKFTPITRQVLLGTALHGLWGRSAPKQLQRAAVHHAWGDVVDNGNAAPVARQDAPDGSMWRDLHSARVSKTFDYFTRGDTVPLLITILQTLRPAHVVMSWMMKHLSKDSRTPRHEALQQFVNPGTSPAWRAFALATELLSDRAHWCALWAYNRKSESAAIGDIWMAMLPAASLLFVRAILATESYPLQLLRVLDGDRAVAAAAAGAFYQCRACCLPAGLHILHGSLSNAQDAESPWFKEICREIAGQLDLANFERELDHSRMRHALQACQGKPCVYRRAAAMHMCQEVGLRHKWTWMCDKPAKLRGRPPAVDKVNCKRCRFDGWNAYVKKAPRPPGPVNMKELGRQWRALSDQEKAPYMDYGVARVAQARAEVAEGADDQRAAPAGGEGERRAPSQGDWGIGSGPFVLRTDLLQTPAYSAALLAEVDAFMASLDEEVLHDPDVLPFNVTQYDSHCEFGVCRSSPAFDKASALLQGFRAMNPKVAALQAFRLESDNGASATFLVAYLRARPPLSVFLPLVPEPPTTEQDIRAGLNLPWRLRFHRSRRSTYPLPLLDLCADHRYFADFGEQCGGDVDVCALTYTPVALDELKVSAVGAGRPLASSVLSDLRSLHELTEQGEESVDGVRKELAELRVGEGRARAQRAKAPPRAAGRGRPDQRPQAKGVGDGPGDGDAAEDDEYEFEAEMRCVVQPALRELREEQARAEAQAANPDFDDPEDTLAGYAEGTLLDELVQGRRQRQGAQPSRRGAPTARASTGLPVPAPTTADPGAAAGAGSSSSSAGGASRQPAASAPDPSLAAASGGAAPTAPGDIDWQYYDQFLVQDPNPRYTNVIDPVSGELLGQLQAVAGTDGPYQCFAVCKLKHHHKPRCSRGRSWKWRDSEEPAQVDRVLAHWLSKGRLCDDSQAHKRLPRF